MTRIIIDQTVPLKDYTVENWEEILEHGSFRGYNIQRLKRKLDKDPGSIGFNKETSTLTYNKNGEIKFEIPLYKIRKCKSRWSASRFIYWIKTTFFCAEKTDVNQLAGLIHEKIQLGGRDKSEEKAKWRDHKAAMHFSTTAEMKEIIPAEPYGLINQMIVTEAHKVLIGKVHQAKEFYKDDYYTFIHGQSLSYFVINQLIKELEKLKQPDQDVSLYHFLRLPHQELKTTSREHIDRSWWHPEYDDLLGDELLSVDGSFFHKIPQESANSFVSSNDNIQITNQYKIISKILKHYAIGEWKDITDGLFKKITELCSKFKALAAIGQIYTISIPKHRFNDLVYTAHPFGVACHCVDKKGQIERLDNLQKNIKAHESECTTSDCDLPQYRILTHFLNPEETPITLHTPVSKVEKDDFKAQIRDLAKTAWDSRVVA